MKISVIIIHYNIKELLRQCLNSLYVSLQNAGIKGEVIVIDNNSTEEDVASLEKEFPVTRFIFNTQNTGFAKACNQGAVVAAGEYLLFLNPDTVLPGQCIKSVIGFAESKPNAGAIGVRMEDEKGQFLKESKRGFPTPWVSFSKLFGLAALFPGSRFFARYYLGHLAIDQTHEVDVVSGAFMLVRKKTFEELGGFDERFFMYGEDIDISHRLKTAAYTNYYFAGCTITHYKGKSTPKDGTYLRHFYGAMILFAEKQYGKKNGYTLFLKAGIALRASLSAIGIFIKNIFKR